VYTWLWRHLPGPLIARVLQALLLFATVVLLLFFVVFPQVEQLLPYNDVTVQQGPATTGDGTAAP
jgi:hypothetical protein